MPSRYNYTPKRILSLSAKDFQSGISTGAHIQGEGLWYTATGVNPFVDPFDPSANVGLLQTYGTPTDMTSSIVVDKPLAGVSRVTAASTGNLYLIGGSGHFYNIDLNAVTVTDLRSGTPITNPANGIGIFKPKGGTQYLYYWQQAQIGRWDLSGVYATGWTDNWSTGLQTTTSHPTHTFAATGAIYYGDKDRIGKVWDVSGTATNTLDVLDIPSDLIVTCLSDDGTYLVAGITRNLGDSSLGALTKVLFWDTFSPSWNKEWIVPDYSINAIRKYGNGFIAFCGRGLYYFDFNTPPKKIRQTSLNSSVAYGYPNAADSNIDMVYYGGIGTYINTYGKMLPSLPTAFLQPFAGLSGGPTFVNGTAKVNRLFVGTDTPKLYSYTLSSSGATGISPQTIYFDLKDVYQIDRVDVVFGIPLASGDSFSVDLKPDESTSVTTYGTATFAADGAIRRKEMAPAAKLKTDQLSMIFNFTAGNVKIKRIDVYGERVSTI